MTLMSDHIHELLYRFQPVQLSGIVVREVSQRAERVSDIGSGAFVRIEKSGVAGHHICALAGFRVDRAGEQSAGDLERLVASLDLAHVGDDEARALVRESADEGYQNYRNEREKATLRRTGKTKTQASSPWVW